MSLTLTRTEIEALEAGPELDRLVAEHVMGYANIRQGWQWESWEGGMLYWNEKPSHMPQNEIRSCLLYGPEDETEPILNYSTDVAAAWYVVENMNVIYAKGKTNQWWANYVAGCTIETSPWHLPARHAAASICRAALISLTPAPTAAEVFEKIAEHHRRSCQ